MGEKFERHKQAWTSDEVAKQNTDAMLEADMAEKSAEFRAKGGEIYLPAAE